MTVAGLKSKLQNVEYRTAACDEPLGRETCRQAFRPRAQGRVAQVESLGAERLSRVELRKMESLRSVRRINKNRSNFFRRHLSASGGFGFYYL